MPKLKPGEPPGAPSQPPASTPLASILLYYSAHTALAGIPYGNPPPPAPTADASPPPAIAEFPIRPEVTPAPDDAKTDAAKKAATDAKKPDAEVDAIRIFKLPAWARYDGTQYPAAKPGKVADPTG